MYCKITLNICNIIIIMNELTIKICSRSLYNIGKKKTHTHLTFEHDIVVILESYLWGSPVMIPNVIT